MKDLRALVGTVREGNKHKAKFKRKIKGREWKRRLTISSQEICFICQARNAKKIGD